MTDNKQHDTRTARRPDCVTEILMGNSVLVVSGYFKKDTTTTAADKMARVLEAEAAATQKPAILLSVGNQFLHALHFPLRGFLPEVVAGKAYRDAHGKQAVINPGMGGVLRVPQVVQR